MTVFKAVGKCVDQQNFGALTGLRFAAAIMVLFWHLPGYLWFPADAFHGLVLAQGVSFFFVLSGFVLQHAYQQRIHEIGWSRFIALRFFRLWPAHIAVLVLVCFRPGAFDWYVHHLPVETIATVVFLLQAWHTKAEVVYAMNSPSWSISAELFFYALFPALTGPMNRRPLTWMAIAFLTSMFWTWSAKDAGQFIEVNPVARLFEFVLGMGCYRLLMRGKALFGTVLEISVLTIAAASVYITSHYYWLIPDAAISYWTTRAGSFVAFAAVIVVFARGKGAVSWILSQPLLIRLGNISFAFYLVHQPVIYGWGEFGIDLPLWQEVPAFIAVTIGLSAALHHLVEMPVMRLMRHILLKRRQPVADASLPEPSPVRPVVSPHA